MPAPARRFRILKVVDPHPRRSSLRTTIAGGFGRAIAFVWMDGRRIHPILEHTWDGFSTGEWVNGPARGDDDAT